MSRRLIVWAENRTKQHQFLSQENAVICNEKINTAKHQSNRSLNLAHTIDHDGYNKASKIRMM